MNTLKQFDPVAVYVDPAIAGVCRTLPPAGTHWPLKQREAWLSAMRTILDLVYTDNLGNDSVEKPAADDLSKDPAG